MGFNTRYPVVYHANPGYHEPDVLIEAVLANPVLAPMVDHGAYRKLDEIPRHHPEFVKIVRDLIETQVNGQGPGDFDIVLIDSPWYDFESYEGVESVTCVTDMTRNAAEFMGLPKWPLAFDFSGFDNTLGYVSLDRKHPDNDSVVTLLVNVTPTKYFKLTQLYNYGTLLGVYQQIADYHKLGKVMVYLEDTADYISVEADKINIGERWYRPVQLRFGGKVVYVPE